MTVTEQLGKRLRYLRKQNKWSQEELAFRAEINKNYLSDLERGTRNPSLDVLVRLSEAFSITLEELFKNISPVPIK